MQTMPFFKDATPAVNRVMRFFVVANIVVIAFCALYLVRQANYLCDGFYVWRGLERVIAAVTGLVPRADDLEWQRNYRETGVLADPRRPAS
jgi:hypothetical protein